MINRVLIRLKIIQIVYAYYQNGSKNLDSAEKELFFSLSKAYDLYNYLLMLMIALTNYAQKRIDAAKAKLAPTAEELYPNMKFVENKFIAQLEVNKQLTEFIANQKRTWANDEDLSRDCMRKLWNQIYIRNIWLLRTILTNTTVNCGESCIRLLSSTTKPWTMCSKTRASTGMTTRRLWILRTENHQAL